MFSSGYLQVSLFSSNIRNNDNRNANIRDICVKSNCIEDVSNKDRFVRSTYTENNCTKSISIFKYLEMHLQFFQVLGVKLFETGLETKILAG